MNSIDIDGAIARRFHRHRSEIGRPAFGQRLELLALDRDERRATGVVTVADAVDKGAVGFKADEISALSSAEPLVEADLDMAVGRFNAPILIGHAWIITGRLHAVMPAQLVITLGEIELGVAVGNFEGGRQRVVRCSPERLRASKAHLAAPRRRLKSSRLQGSPARAPNR